MSKTKIILSGKKAYIAPTSYCLKVSSNNICVNSFKGDHNTANPGGDIWLLEVEK